jgi:hypothetical protein
MKIQQVTTRTAEVVLVDEVRNSPVDIHLSKTRQRLLIAILIAILIIIFIALTR